MSMDLTYLKKSLWFIVLFGIVSGVVSYIVAQQRQPVYEAVQSYEIQMVNRPTTPDYQYGSYYDLKGAELYTQYLMSLLRSAVVIQSIYHTAGMSTQIDNLSQFTNQFKMVEDSSQHFTVTFDRYNKAEADSLAASMTTVLTKAVSDGDKDVSGNNLFTLRPYDAVVVYQTTNVLLYTVVGSVAGWLLAIVLVYLRRYLKA